MSDTPYKFKTTMEDYTLKVEAVPQIEAISRLYATLSKGIDEELIRNMPEDAIIKLLSQLLEECIGRPYIRKEVSDEANTLLLGLKEYYGV